MSLSGCQSVKLPIKKVREFGALIRLSVSLSGCQSVMFCMELPKKCTRVRRHSKIHFFYTHLYGSKNSTIVPDPIRQDSKVA